jgi:hypothetical protein
MMDGWFDIKSAPRDGTPVDLCWTENGEIAEQYGPMVWNVFAGNPLVQSGKGIWACHSKTGEILFTWSESNPDGSPEFWRPHTVEGDK